MKISSRLSKIWPTLLIIASVGLIAIALLNLFFPTLLKFNKTHRVVNISCFVYRDVNRNGIYDVEDRPYAGLKITMDRPKGGSVQRESNISGFANFEMSLGYKKADIYSPGAHTIHVEAPNGWEVSSENSAQTIVIKKRAGTATGMIAERTFDPVGVVPHLSISGTIKIDSSDLELSNTVLEAYSPENEQSVVTVSKSGKYSLPAMAGKWKLDLITANDKSTSRELEVNAYPLIVSQIDPDSKSIQAKPNLRTIGFDNLTTSDTLYEIPNGYEGLDWRNWVATHQKLYQGNGYINANVSSEYVAYMSSGHPATISSEETFDFVGAYVGAAWPEAEDHDVVIKAWRRDLEVYEDRFRASTAGPIYFDADYRDISRIEFSSDGYWQIVLDDFTIRSK